MSAADRALPSYTAKHGDMALPAALEDIQRATRVHLRAHGCGAYTFEDGPSLARLARDMDARRVLELGTALGYTACCLAQGRADSQVDTLEADAEHVDLARTHIAAAGLAGRVTVHLGDFADLLPRLSPGYDLAFFDGFAPSRDVLRQLQDLLRTGGVLVCANLPLAHGAERQRMAEVLDDTARWMPMPSIEQGRTLVRVKQ